MQKVIHEYRNKSRLFTMMELLFAYVSDCDNNADEILWLDEVFTPLCDTLSENIFSFRYPTIKHFDIPEIEHSEGDQDEIIVCLSGGKDSAALAYYYKKLGYKVHLYHATGVNKAYGDEKNAAQRIADYLGCDLFIDKVWLEGSNTYVEHPMKNYVIADGAIHYALGRGYRPVIAFGNFSHSYLKENPFNVCAGDCIEMWDLYRDIVRKVLPDFDIEIPLKTNADTFDILSENKELFNLAVSCMSPFRFREHWKHRTEEHYNLRLLDYRCGCCWKCCMEAIWLMDTDKMDFNEEYYRHCIDILSKTIKKETGHKTKSIETIWSKYMFYPLFQSKLNRKE